MENIEIIKGGRYLAENDDDIIELKILEVSDCCYRVQYHGVTKWETKKEFHNSQTIIEKLKEKLL